MSGLDVASSRGLVQGVDAPDAEHDFQELNDGFEKMDAEDIMKWAVETFGDGLVVTTSFGIQSAVMLHMATRMKPDVKVVWVDTGYFPPESYQYAEILKEKLNLNLYVYQSEITPARMEALHGKLWEKRDAESLKIYNKIRKVEPLHRAFEELNCTGWVTGVRRSQTEFRKSLNYFQREGSQAKIMPLLDWGARDVSKYLKKYDLPKHPLEQQGYTTVGDWHSSRALTVNDLCDRDTRFMGLIQECGIHTS